MGISYSKSLLEETAENNEANQDLKKDCNDATAAPPYFEDVCAAIEGIQRCIFSYMDFRSLHLVRGNTDLTRYANEEMERRALRAGSTDARKRVKKLRRLIQKAQPGQTIRLASGMYMLGDESVRGHASERIFYDTNGEENGGEEGEGMEEYDQDVNWNSWRKGYGPITLSSPGVKLVGPNPSEEPAVFFFNATAGWAEDSVAFHVNTKGIVFENITIQGPCEAIDVGIDGADDYFSDSDATVNDAMDKCSVIIKNCQIQGCVSLFRGSEALIQDSIIRDHVALADKAAISVFQGASLRLERTAIVNCLDRHPTVPSRLAGPGLMLIKAGALYIDGRVVAKDVNITNNWPAGILFGSAKGPKLIVAGSMTVAGNRGELPADHPLVRYMGRDRRTGVHSGNLLLLNTFDELVESDGTDEGLAGLEELRKVVEQGE